MKEGNIKENVIVVTTTTIVIEDIQISSRTTEA